MEDSSQGSHRSRLLRPESSSSNHTRMTPASSSNGSSAHLPTRMNPNSSGRTTPSGGASLLQERLRDRKVEASRSLRRGSVDSHHLRDREVQSSPITREDKRPSSGGVKALGVKSMEEQASTLHKQNFDLKLELYHRRQKQEDLENRLEAAEKRIEQQAETEEINDQLVAEMEKLIAELETREQALEEAVTVIVRLEDEVEQLKKERERVQSIEADYQSTYFRLSHKGDYPSSPPEFDDRKTTRSGNSVPRMPSFLSEKSEGTEALRSLYLPTSKRNFSEATLAPGADVTPANGMDSPRLSMLSESSFVSVYGEKSMQLDNGPHRPESPSPPRRHRANRSSVEKWIDERPATVVPARQVSRSGLQKSQYKSINSMMEQLDSPLQRLEKLKYTLNKHNSSQSVSQRSLQPPAFSSPRRLRTAKESSRGSLSNQDSFEQRNLPPTPDTFTSDTLRNLQKLQGERSASENPPTREDSFLSGKALFPPGYPSRSRYPSDSSSRPRSAGETIRSRRDGHGWEAEAQGDFAETASISSASSMYNGPGTQSRKRVVTPDLFTFGNQDREWGPEATYNTSAHVPHSSNAAADQYRAARRSSMFEHPQSDDPVLPRSARITDLSSSGTVSPPDRHSSLSAATKLKKNPPNDPPTPTQPSQQPAAASPAKSSKISQLSGKLFGRGGRSEVCPGSPNKAQGFRTPLSEEFGEEARATPPPIRRNRTSMPASVTLGGGEARPTTAAGFGPGRRATDFSAYDGIAENGQVVNGTPDVESSEGKNSPLSGGMGRKWFGIGRPGSGSVSRRH
ncbi:hypothetical protein HYALB_00000519 [Hymenoscyphus albidus]|uniref:Centrosomin N-terminal motif 1 domain-containing protein n=1 Tax=Hymenoscyphus albidus TaxID=595503 RepID=A0A9N9M0Z1_9HELO|nr:hypothetical protein HYALB_00000519 [Hymenoscyphus albidus]